MQWERQWRTEPCRRSPFRPFTVEVPADRANGDYATNAAMACAKAFHMAPRKIAEEVLARMDLADTFFSRCEAAGPGFLNFFLADSYYAAILKDIRACGKGYGRSICRGKRRDGRIWYPLTQPAQCIWAMPAAAHWEIA